MIPLIVLSAPGPATSKAAKRPKRVAVLLVSTGGVPSELGDNLTEAFIAALSAKGGYVIRGKEEFRAAIGRGEHGVLECLKRPVCLSTVGTGMGVDLVAVGTLGRGTTAKTYRLILLLIRVGTGKVRYRMTLNVKGGPKNLLDAVVKAAPKLLNPPPLPIRLTLRINLAQAVVTVGGRPLAVGPNGKVKGLKPGTHTIRVSKKGYVAQEVTVRLKPGDNKELSIALVPVPKPIIRDRVRKQRWYQKWWVWTIVAGAAVTAASVALPLVLYEKKAPRGSLGTLSYP